MFMFPWCKSLQVLSLLLIFAVIAYGQPLEKGEKVKPYEFGFTIDKYSQQHRHEKRDERGIVMGEFGFITADGIYHVTVYATDEEGKFRILAMRNYPYESPPKTIEMIVQPKPKPVTTTTTTTPRPIIEKKPLPKHNFNTKACSGCSLKNGNEKETPSVLTISSNAQKDTQNLNKNSPNLDTNLASRPVLQPPLVTNAIQGIVNKMIKIVGGKNLQTPVSTQRPFEITKSNQGTTPITTTKLQNVQTFEPTQKTLVVAPTKNRISTETQFGKQGPQSLHPSSIPQNSIDISGLKQPLFTTITQNSIAGIPNGLPSKTIQDSVGITQATQSPIDSIGYQNGQSSITTQKPLKTIVRTPATTTQSKINGISAPTHTLLSQKSLETIIPAQNVPSQAAQSNINGPSIPTNTLLSQKASDAITRAQNPPATTTQSKINGISAPTHTLLSQKSLETIIPAQNVPAQTAQSNINGPSNPTNTILSQKSPDAITPAQNPPATTTPSQVNGISEPTKSQNPLDIINPTQNRIYTETQLGIKRLENVLPSTTTQNSQGTTKSTQTPSTQINISSLQKVQPSTSQKPLEITTPALNIPIATTQTRVDDLQNPTKIQNPVAVVKPTLNQFTTPTQFGIGGLQNAPPSTLTQKPVEITNPTQIPITTTALNSIVVVPNRRPSTITQNDVQNPTKTQNPVKVLRPTLNQPITPTQFGIVDLQNVTPSTLTQKSVDITKPTQIPITKTTQDSIVGVSNGQPSTIAQKDLNKISLSQNSPATPTQTKINALVDPSKIQNLLETIKPTQNQIITDSKLKMVGIENVKPFSGTQQLLETTKATLTSVNQISTTTPKPLQTISTLSAINTPTIITPSTPANSKENTPITPILTPQTPAIKTITNNRIEETPSLAPINPTLTESLLGKPIVNSNQPVGPVLNSATKTPSAPSTVNTASRIGTSSGTPEVDLRVTENTLTPQKPAGAQNNAATRSGNAGSSGGSPTKNNLPIDFAQRIGEELMENLRGQNSAGGKSNPAGDGDLYHFKYLLDYNGHEETGARNGNKVGNYFSIGDDNVERTIEYIANEFGFQPRIRWRKLDAARVKPAENALKEYEFVWFRKD